MRTSLHIFVIAASREFFEVSGFLVVTRVSPGRREQNAAGASALLPGEPAPNRTGALPSASWPPRAFAAALLAVAARRAARGVSAAPGARARPAALSVAAFAPSGSAPDTIFALSSGAGVRSQ